MSGKYPSLKDMAKNINDGQPPKMVEDVIFKNMMKNMIKKFNE